MRRQVSAILALVLAFIASTLFTSSSQQSVFSESYPVVVCPPTSKGITSQISVSSSKTQFQRLENRSTKTIPFNSLRYAVPKESVVISANGVTPVVWQSRSNSWAGGALCTGPMTSQWFVGGSSDVTTRGRLIVINSGLSEATVDLQTYSENGMKPVKSLNLKSKSYTAVPLDSLATGDKELTVHVLARAGRVNAFMIDELGAGLRALGGDFVNPISSPATTLVIPAIPNQLPKQGQKVSGSHTLRILAPADSDAIFTLELLSADGKFVPVGFDSRKISAGSVTAFTIKPNLSASAFAVRIKSDEPVVAAISSSVTINGRKDFLWSTPTPILSPMILAVTGLSPLIAFGGDSIDIKAEVTLINGKKILTTIKGTDIATWRVPNGARSISIITTSPNTYAGALVASSNGYGYLPIAPGSVLTRVEVPHSNIKVLNP
jgi:hypothetical protein